MCGVMRDNERQRQEEWGLCQGRSGFSQILSSAECKYLGAGGDGHLEVTVEEQPQVAGKEGLAGTLALFA